MIIYIVEDDPWYSGMLEHHLGKNPDWKVRVFGNGNDLMKALSQKSSGKTDEKPDVLTLDYNLPDGTAHDWLPKIIKCVPELKVLIVSSQEDIATAVDLLKVGAYDYAVKDEGTLEHLWNSMVHLQDHLALKEEVVELRKTVAKGQKVRQRIVGQSEGIRLVFELIEKAASTHIPVSITGETGTGKELVAQSIHMQSARPEAPFIAVNVSAVPESLVESELFGHEKGAFTGASGNRTGRFEEVDKGTLFLDEIAEMPLSVQAKLLRVIQEREFCRVGSNKMIPLKCRLITATHRDLGEMVSDGTFRQDLFYRLMGFPIEVPALRNRAEDIPLIAEAVLMRYAEESGMEPKECSADALNKLLVYAYPGNVRELVAVVQLAAVMAGNGNKIRPEHIRFIGANKSENVLEQEMTMKEFEEEIIKIYLKRCNGSVQEAARKLQVGKSTIYRYLQRGRDAVEFQKKS